MAGDPVELGEGGGFAGRGEWEGLGGRGHGLPLVVDESWADVVETKWHCGLDPRAMFAALYSCFAKAVECVEVCFRPEIIQRCQVAATRNLARLSNRLGECIV